MLDGLDDPAYIQSLFDSDSDYSCYFCIGDPSKGPIERIGVVPPMLMAHSLVLRRALDVPKSELKEKWDIYVSDISVKTFRNVLRYTYGFNNIKHHSLTQSLELLSLANRWVMKTMSNDLANHIAGFLTPVNVCLAMKDPIVLKVKKVEETIAQILTNYTKRVLSSPFLCKVCPAGMRYIVQLKSLHATEEDVWRCVMRWAHEKAVAKNRHPTQLDDFRQPKLVVPCQKYTEMCALNLIDLVEEVGANHPNKLQNIEAIKKYHLISKSTSGLYFCTESKNAHHLKHEEFQVKVVNTSEHWMNPIHLESSMVKITNNTDSMIELYSVVCSSRQESDLSDLVEVADVSRLDSEPYPLQSTKDYVAGGSVIVTLMDQGISDEEITCLRRPILQYNFIEHVSFGQSFQIVLSLECDKLQLLPHRTYRIEIKFYENPHPLWYTNEISPSPECDLDVTCGVVDTERSFHASHMKQFVYRKCLQEK